ncbi:MAG: helix-turn-helix domain-containing protein [Gammaproteobacteria bacterium]|nr:helix-turn-helix domain-containing protein [Gammaproteobacteria bacterium]MCP5458270.1 helix-turn-helix domain-containing protein [Gammaproteobacteria bacterium]
MFRRTKSNMARRSGGGRESTHAPTALGCGGNQLQGAGCREQDALGQGRLSVSDRPVAEIAATLGYTDASNFARAFRRETGVSPRTYRMSRLLG